ncbi:family 16 glycosylhydrolase [Reichenbachiella sp.]|uniref:family 16 glycosylhydrolase n=1 Tax=Reichenbachiella sp. TaxID=2184521 RepID=UPI003BAFC43F
MHVMKLLTLVATYIFISTTALFAQDYPLSDPDNTGKWILNGDFSDEFEADTLNRSRWHLQGEYLPGCEGDACRDGIYYNGFKGRWPAQFSKDNAWLAQGKLILETRWDSDFNFLNDCDDGNTEYCYGKDLDGNALPITTAGVNTLKQFTYGYMEISSKAADAEITSAFWTIGSGAEIDMFEMFGKYEPAAKKHKEKELKFNMIEWATGFEPRFDTFIPTDWRVADDFHVYGFEWDDKSISVYLDGEFVQTFTAADFNKGEGTDWFFTGSQRLWVDQECFPWNGLPNEEDLPAQYEIEYIRVWQKENQIEDQTAPILSDLDITLAETGGQVSAITSEQAQVYMVPEGTAKDLDEIKAKDTNPHVSNEGLATVETRGYDPNRYILYAVDWAGNISEASAAFKVESAPVLDIDQRNSNWLLAPNPARSEIKILGLERYALDSLDFHNTMGQTFRLPVIGNNMINVETLPTGIYLINAPHQSPIKFVKVN